MNIFEITLLNIVKLGWIFRVKYIFNPYKKIYKLFAFNIF